MLRVLYGGEYVVCISCVCEHVLCACCMWYVCCKCEVCVLHVYIFCIQVHVLCLILYMLYYELYIVCTRFVYNCVVCTVCVYILSVGSMIDDK
jgi:hypothetical protein